MSLRTGWFIKRVPWHPGLLHREILKSCLKKENRKKEENEEERKEGKKEIRKVQFSRNTLF